MTFKDQIIFEDNHLLVINKFSGQLSQGDKTDDLSLVDLGKQYIKEAYDEPGNVFLGLVHRIDRPTSGVIIMAKTSKALTRLNQMLKDRLIQKTYWAIIPKQKIQKERTLINYLKKNPKNNKSYVYDKEIEGSKKAVLHYKIIQELDLYHLIEIQLETGRHHQIRAQLSHIDCPIKGDLKYGFKRPNPHGSIHLHARSVEFIHPVTKENIHLVAEPDIEDSIWKYCI